MRIFRIILLALSSLIVLAALAAVFYGRHLSRRALPDYTKNISIASLNADVEVIRDSYGVPHVYASTERDLYMAVGYLSAQDRMWQMDLLRRVTQGRLSEIFGQDLVDVDLTMRSLQIQEKSASIYAESPPELKEALDAYAEGVNKYLADQGKKLPLEFGVLGYQPEEWDPTHCINLIGYMSWDLSMSWSTELVLYKIGKVVDSLKLAELYPDLELQKPVIYPEFTKVLDSVVVSSSEPYLAQREKLSQLGLQVFQGSNNWAVNASRSTEGKPILANDMHLGLFAPGIWSQMHQVVDGKVNVTGVILPGQPFIIAGHNENIAWGMTNVMLDDIDFYQERTDSAHPGQYWFNGQWRDLVKKTEVIKIKGGEQVTREIEFTHRGPVVSGMKKIEGAVVSMRWVGMEKSNEVASVYQLNHAASWVDFLKACDGFVAVAQNIVYADVQGNIGLHCTGGVPIRPGNRAFVSPGDSSIYDWTGIVPISELPFTYNPASGTVSSANNRTVGSEYPYDISHWFDVPNRIRRIRELLDSKPKHGIEDFIRIQSDQQSVLAKELNAHFVHEIKWEEGMDPLAREAFEALRLWDHELGSNSAAALIFETTYHELLTGMFKDEMGESLFKEFIKQDLLASYALEKILAGGNSLWCDDVGTEATENFGDMVRAAFDRAVKRLSADYGSEIADWEWGKAHQLSLKHPMGSVKALSFAFGLNRGPYPVGGSFHTVSPYSYDMNAPFTANHGASHRHIYVVGDWDKSMTIIATGVSGMSSSRHYCDQTEMYIANQYHPDPFSRQAVEAAAKYRMVFSRGS
jgi:penicillin G amidase